MDLTGAIEGYEAHHKGLKKLAAETTLKSYVGMIRGFVEWTKATDTSELDRIKFMRYYDSICARVPKRALQARAACRSWAKYLIRIEEISEDFTAGVVLPRTDPSERRAPAESDIDKLLGAVEEMHFCGNLKAQDHKRHVTRAVLYLLVFCGLRRKEVFDLRIEDIDFENRQIFVRLGKGNKPGYVKAPAEFWPIIRAYLKQRPAYPGKILLAYSDTQPLGAVSVSRIFEKVVKAAGLSGQGITPHTMRHAMAVRGIENGADLKTIQTQMRHQHLQTTLKYLVTNRPVTDEKAAAFGRSSVPSGPGPEEVQRQEQAPPTVQVEQKPAQRPVRRTGQGSRSVAPGRVRIDLRRPPETGKKVLRMVTRRTA